MTLEIYLNSVNTYYLKEYFMISIWHLIAVISFKVWQIRKIFLLNRIECIIISNKLSFNIHEEEIPSIIQWWSSGDDDVSKLSTKTVCALLFNLYYVLSPMNDLFGWAAKHMFNFLFILLSNMKRSCSHHLSCVQSFW